MRNIRFFLLFIVTASFVYSCKTLMSYVNVVKCDFRMKSVTDTRLSGIQIQKLQTFSDLNLFQVGNLTKAYLAGNVPLEFMLHIEGKNPNTSQATMASFDWILLIDDIQMVSGTNEQEYLIPANGGTKNIPLKISVNLLEVLNNETKDALLNFGFNLADAGGKPTRVGLKLRPTINVGGVPVTYPGYIDLGTEFGGAE